MNSSVSEFRNCMRLFLYFVVSTALGTGNISQDVECLNLTVTFSPKLDPCFFLIAKSQNNFSNTTTLNCWGAPEQLSLLLPLVASHGLCKGCAGGMNKSSKLALQIPVVLRIWCPTVKNLHWDGGNTE